MIDEFPREWFLYLRKSVGYAGIARQRAATTAMIERRGGKVAEDGEFSDEDKTAFRNTHRDLDAPLPPRPNFDRMLAELATRPGTGVAAWHADRLGRDPEAGEILIRACRRDGGHLIATKAGGDYDVTTSNGRSHLRADVNAANDEVDHNVERMLEAKAEAAGEGRWLGGPRPFGWAVLEDGTLALHELEAPAIASGSDSVLAGATVYGITAAWRAAGLTGTRGGVLTPDDVRVILMRPRNAALMEHRGQLVDLGTGDDGKPRRAGWPAIVDEGKWRAVCAVLSDPARRTSPGPAPSHLMSGIALCWTCGAAVTSKSRGTGRDPAYRCSLAARNLPRRPGPHAGCHAPSLDAYIGYLAVSRLEQPDAEHLLRADRGEERGALLGKRDGIEAKNRRDFELYQAEVLTDLELATARRTARGQLAAIDEKLRAIEAADAVAPFLGNPRRAWDSAVLDQKRALVSALVHVTVLPGSGHSRPPGWKPGEGHFDPRLVDVRWARWLPSDG